MQTPVLIPSGGQGPTASVGDPFHRVSSSRRRGDEDGFASLFGAALSAIGASPNSLPSFQAPPSRPVREGAKITARNDASESRSVPPGGASSPKTEASSRENLTTSAEPPEALHSEKESFDLSQGEVTSTTPDPVDPTATADPVGNPEINPLLQVVGTTPATAELGEHPSPLPVATAGAPDGPLTPVPTTQGPLDPESQAPTQIPRRGDAPATQSLSPTPTATPQQTSTTLARVENPETAPTDTLSRRSASVEMLFLQTSMTRTANTTVLASALTQVSASLGADTLADTTSGESPSVTPGLDSPAMIPQASGIHMSSVNSGTFQSASAPQATQQVAHAIAVQAEMVQSTGRVDFHLRLDPPELGEVRVHLTLTEQTLTARLVVHEASTQQLLQNHLDMLRLRLLEMGVTMGNVDVHYGGRQDGGHHAQGESQGFRGFFHPEGPKDFPPLQVVGSRRQVVAADRIDVMV